MHEEVESVFEVSCIEVHDTGEVTVFKDVFVGTDNEDALDKARDHAFESDCGNNVYIVSAKKIYDCWH